MKTLTFVFGLWIGAFGAVSIVLPSASVWVARLFDTPGAFYAVAAVRIAFGFILISVAPDSRMPRTLSVLGFIILLLGFTTALLGLVGIAPARAAIESWLQLGPVVIRLTAVFILAFGGFIAYACAPVRRTATHP